MAHRRSTPDRIAAEIADATGRTEQEVKVFLGAATVAAVVAVAFRAIKGLLDMVFLDPARSGHR